MSSSQLQRFPEHDPNSPLSVHAMTVAYNQRPVLWDVDYDAPPAKIIAVVGPNGAGKSTFLKAVVEAIPRSTGIVEFWGKPFSASRNRIAYVPQRESVDWDFPVSVLDVVAMGRYSKVGWFRAITGEHYSAARHALAKVGMEGFAERQISQLSGGQQQRVFIARALAQEADLYLMDEPFAGVDAATEAVIVTILRDLRTAGKTVMCVHHDLTTIPQYFDEVLLLNTRLIAAGPVADTFTKENLAKTYGGRLSVLDELSAKIGKSA